MAMTGLPLSPQVFAIVAGLIEDHAGLHYSLSDRELLADKVSVRAMDRGFDSLLDYYYYLRYDPGGPEELDALVESLVVGETYFFRELRALEVVVDELLAPVVREGRRPRVWSAACSTGEEPLTLSMLLADRGLLGKVEVVATDLSARALAKAQQGVYGPRSVRTGAPPRLVERYLRREGEGYGVAPELVKAVRWSRLNLLDPVAVAALGRFDVILCRNVLIYFRDERSRQVVERLAQQLEPGGALLVSVSESLLRFGTSLECEEHGGAFLYRKVR